MSFRPLTDTERVETLEKIARAEERIQALQTHLVSLRRELEEGVWCSDVDWQESKQ